MAENRRFVLLALLLTAAVMGWGVVNLLQAVYSLPFIDFIDTPVLGKNIRTAHLFGNVSVFLAAFYIYKKKDYMDWLESVVYELRLVKWPTREEIKSATIVCLILVAIMALIFWIYDIIFSKLSNIVY